MSASTAPSQSAAAAAPLSAKPNPDNGMAALPADQIVKKAQQALISADSYHINANMIHEGTTEDGGHEEFNLVVDGSVANDKGAVGTLRGLGGTVKVIGTPDMVFLQGDSAWITDIATPAAAKALTGKWLSASPTSENRRRYVRLSVEIVAPPAAQVRPYEDLAKLAS